jgi:hypothetical protein
MEERRMPDMDAALENQKRNIAGRTGRPFDEWVGLARSSGVTQHGALVAWLKSEHGFGHGDANLVALTARRPDASTEDADPLDAIYAGPKASLRPFHDLVITTAQAFGDDVELAPKAAYVSLRRAKQFGMVGPASGGRLEIGFNLKGVEPTDRLEATTGMCTHRVRLSDADGFDDEVRGWLREAYDRA